MSVKRKKEQPKVVVGPATALLIDAAKTGDYDSLGALFGQAGALLAADGPMPEPLLSFMQERLFAIAHCLQKPGKFEYRDEILKAVVPVRRSGPKNKKPALLPYTYKEGMIAFCLERAVGTLDDRIAAVMNLFHVERTTVLEARLKVGKAGHLKP